MICSEVVNKDRRNRKDNNTMSTKDTVSELLSDEPTTISQLVEATGKSDSTVRKAVKELVEAGDAVEVDTDNGKGFTAKPANTRRNHGYARNTSKTKAADERDAQVIEFVGSADGTVKLTDIAEALSITVRAARHAAWRLGRQGRLAQPERGQYELPQDGELVDA
jgi:DNA-binding IclR family transcriptional regulator